MDFRGSVKNEAEISSIAPDDTGSFFTHENLLYRFVNLVEHEQDKMIRVIAK